MMNEVSRGIGRDRMLRRSPEIHKGTFILDYWHWSRECLSLPALASEWLNTLAVMIDHSSTV